MLFGRFFSPLNGQAMAGGALCNVHYQRLAAIAAGGKVMSEGTHSPFLQGSSVAVVRCIQFARTARACFFKQELFSDPGWGILLELYACELAQRRVAAADVCAATNMPLTTGMRWMRKLEQEGLVVRVPQRLDARRQWIALTSVGSSAMQQYCKVVATRCEL